MAVDAEDKRHLEEQISAAEKSMQAIDAQMIAMQERAAKRDRRDNELRAQKKALSELKGKKRQLEQKISTKQDSLWQMAQGAEEETKAQISAVNSQKVSIVAEFMAHMKLRARLSMDKVYMALETVGMTAEKTKLETDCKEGSAELRVLEQACAMLEQCKACLLEKCKGMLRRAREICNMDPGKSVVPPDLHTAFSQMPNTLDEMDAMLNEERGPGQSASLASVKMAIYPAEMAQETNQSQAPMLCATGCGFFGNPRTSGMCSVCYKDHLTRQNNGGVSPLSAMGGSVSNSPTMEASAIQRIEATLNNAAAAAAAEADAEAASGAAAALPVTQQMTEMSISCEEEGASPKAELAEPVVTQPIASASPPSAAGSDESKLPEPAKPKKNRCFMCRKKVGLTGFDCRCGNLFCGLHRYSDEHNCPYDYKAEAAAKIRKENPVVVADKIQRI